MDPFTPSDAQNLADFARNYLDDLTHAAQSAATPVDADERGWLQLGVERIGRCLQASDAALFAAWPLPELESIRKRELRSRQEAWGDTVAELYAGIVEHTSANAPLVEVLFPHCRFEKLKRPGASSDQYHAEWTRRRRTQYVQRLSGEPEYAFLNPLLEVVARAREQLEQCQHPAEVAVERLEQLRNAVADTAQSLSQRLEQARILASAALVASPDHLANLGLTTKPRRRATRRPPAST